MPFIVFVLFYPLEIGNLLRSYEYLLLTSRLPDFSKVVFFAFVLIVGCVLFWWRCYGLVVQVGLNCLLFYLEIKFSLILVPAFFPNILKYFWCTCWVVFVSIGKTLLRKDVLDKMSLFMIIAFPYKDRVLVESLFICFSIFSSMVSQFICFA